MFTFKYKTPKQSYRRAAFSFVKMAGLIRILKELMFTRKTAYKAKMTVAPISRQLDNGRAIIYTLLVSNHTTNSKAVIAANNGNPTIVNNTA